MSESSPPLPGTSSAAGPLAGLRVLDLGRVIAAPYAAQILGDLGADVIKIERPGVGDDARRYPPVYMPGGEGGARGDAAHFIAVNRNKRSITLDLSKPLGQDIMRGLVAQADVLIENYIPGTLQRYGLGHQPLCSLNPRLVYCSISGYGQNGPQATHPGFDTVAQALSGLMSVTGAPDGQPGAGPTMVGVVVEDMVTGKDAATAILAALYARDTRTGRGQYIDASLLDSAVALMGYTAQQYLITGVAPTRHASMGVEVGISGILECRDGHVYFTATRDHFFNALCQVLGCAHLAADPRHVTGPLRWQHRHTLATALHEHARQRSARELAPALSAAGVPAAVVNDLSQTFDEPQVHSRGLRVPLPHPHDPNLQVVASPLRLAQTPVRYERPPPLLGQHTDEILCGLLGMSLDEVAAARTAGVV